MHCTMYSKHVKMDVNYTVTEFVNKLWIELFSELKILHTRTPPYNPSSNIIERWHRTIIVSILRTMGSEMQNEWDLGVKAACLAYNTAVHSSTRSDTVLCNLWERSYCFHPLGVPNSQA